MIHTDGQATIANAPVATADVLVTNHGSIFTFRPLTERAAEWLTENVDGEVQFFGNVLAVEPRYAFDLADGLLDEGFVLS